MHALARRDAVAQAKAAGHDGVIIAQVDFLGEGDEERLTGKIYGFRRGVTRYPVPGSPIYPATSTDLRQIYASDGRTVVSRPNRRRMGWAQWWPVRTAMPSWFMALPTSSVV